MRMVAGRNRPVDERVLPRPKSIADGAPSELLGAVVAVHGVALHAYVLRLTGDPHRTDDVVQETLVRAWRHPEALNGSKGSPRAWLFTVARRISVDEWRREDRRRRREEEGANAMRGWATPDSLNRIVDDSIIHAALEDLSPEHREVLVQTVWYGRSVAEAADEIGIPVGTIKSRSYYALRSLRHSLDDMGFFT
jgi:RNA polymerase sigma-70 factor (ECF subfamily)